MMRVGRRLLMLAVISVALALDNASNVPILLTTSRATTVTSGLSWPTYGANVSNTRSNPGGPSPQTISGLHLAGQFDTARPCTGTPIVSGGMVFSGCTGGGIFALSQNSGTPLWHALVDGSVNSSAAVANGLVYFAVSKTSAPYVVAFNATNGAAVWRTVLTTQQGSDVYSSPQVSANDIVIGTSAGFNETHTTTPTTRGCVVRLNGTTGAVE